MHTSHTSDGVLLAYLDHELAGDQRSNVDAHLNECLTCRRALGEVRGRADLVSDALSLVDRPAPIDEAWITVHAAVQARVATGAGDPSRAGAVAPRTGAVPPGGRAWVPARWSLARAAGLVLLFAGGAAAATIPGSPVRSWLFGDDPMQPMASPATEEAASATVTAESGSWTRAVDGVVRLALDAPAGTDVEVRWTGQRAGIQGPADTRYASEADGQLGARAEGGPLRVELPVGIRAATLRVNGAVVLEIVEGRVSTAPAGARGTLEPDGEPLYFEVR